MKKMKKKIESCENESAIKKFTLDVLKNYAEKKKIDITNAKDNKKNPLKDDYIQGIFNFISKNKKKWK